MKKRLMTVVDTPSRHRTPMIRITNRFLSRSGFDIGDAISVDFRPNKIIINRLNKSNE
jgi:hypothetical protein